MPRELPAAALEKFLVGFDGITLPPQLGDFLAHGLTGVALFPRNFTSAEGLRALAEEIQNAAGRPTLIAIDQEGGRQFSLPEPFTQWPSAGEIGSLDDPEIVERVARSIARELRAVGCNMDFAPMLDLSLRLDSPVTSERSFGNIPEHVGRMGAAFVRGLAAGGLLGCAKHFPGHGDTQIDPHQDLPVFQVGAERLQKMELVPFRNAIAAGVPAIMTAHVLLPRIDSVRPASLSRSIVHELLREWLGFRGVCVADDLGMGAIRKRRSPAEAAIETFQAGSDLALLCHAWALLEPTIEAVARVHAGGNLNFNEWAMSHERIERLRAQVADPSAAPPLDVVGCTEHRALANEVFEKIRAKSELVKTPHG